VSAIERIVGTALPMRGDDIDTDRIMPARFLTAVSFEGLEDHVFEDDRDAPTARGDRHPFVDPAYRGASIMIVNRHFGCGSSREHAPQGLRRWGIQAIVGESFSEIFFGNAVKLGIACVTAPAADVERLMAGAETTPGAPIDVSLRELSVTAGSHTVAVDMPAAAREALLAGTWDATALLLNDFEQVEAVAERLPYVRGFA